MRGIAGSLTESVLLAVESLKHNNDTLEGNTALRRSLALLPRSIVQLEHDNWVNALAFSPDGARLATVSDDKTARSWTLDINKIMAEACSRVNRNMTREEWGRFMDNPDADCLTCPREGSFNKSSIWPWGRRECQTCIGNLS